ncbi:MAG: SPFH domain-containing protein [Psychrobium sp.]|nr:SPFH domain-containing protein [Psychrobium sp.]
MTTNITEKKGWSISGYNIVALLALNIVVFLTAMITIDGEQKLFFIALIPVSIFIGFGFYMVQPKQARLQVLFGKYIGTDTTTGLRWANPLLIKQKISLRVRNFESDTLKVNDQLGNPIQIASVVVWEVVNSAEAVFEVDEYESFVHIQSEAALRNLAANYPYDQHDGDDQVSLRSHANVVADALQKEIQSRLSKAGVNVIEARISHLAYAPEIASAMLQRQQAAAIISARERIVEGAVGMVEMALNRLSEKNIVELDEERKAAMVSNLLVVLCSDNNTQPVINTGSLYN